MATGSTFLIRQYAYDLGRKNPSVEAKLLSERDLCEIYDVSRTTVRKALEELVSEGYLVIRKGVGTFTNPAMFPAFKTPGSNLSIGIVIGSGKNVLYTDYFWKIISAVGKVITDDFGSVRMIQLVHDDERAAREVLALNLDGLVWIHPFQERINLIHQLQKSNLPVMCVGYNPEEPDLNNVVKDYYQIGYMVADCLIKRGHRDIIYIKSDGLWSEDLSLQGFKKAFSDNKLQYNNKLILDNPGEISSDIQNMIRFGVNFSACFAFGTCVWDVISVLQENFGDNYMDKCEIVSNTSGCGNAYLNCAFVDTEGENQGGIAAEKLMDLISGTISQPVNVILNPQIKNIPPERIDRELSQQNTSDSEVTNKEKVFNS